MFFKIGVLRNFAIFKRETSKGETPTQEFLCEYCEFFKNTSFFIEHTSFFYRTHPVAASG